MEIKPIYLIGGGVLAWLLLKGNSSAGTASNILTTNSTTPTVANAPAPPATYNDAYYKTYQYPALVAAYPNLKNPGYQLTDQDANNYLNNYLELQQWLPNAVDNKGHKYPSNKAALQYHWSTFGVPYQYSFIPFTPPKNVNWTPPPANPKSSGGGGFLSSALSVVSAALPYVALLAGTDEIGEMPILNDADIELVVTSSAVVKEILPFYLQSDKKLVDSISNRIDQLLTQYEI